MKSKLSAFAMAVLFPGLLTLLSSVSVNAATLTLNDSNCTSFSVDTSTGNAVVSCNVTPVPPTCSVVASPASLPIGGGAVTLTATCGPGPITGHIWTGDAAAVATTTSVVNTSIQTTTNFSVKATNANGTGAAANSTVTVGTPVAAPTCTLTASPTSISAGGSATLTASCSPAATSYTWTGSGFGSTTVGGTVQPAATTTYTVQGVNVGGSGNIASATVTVASGGGGGESGIPTSCRSSPNANALTLAVKTDPKFNWDLAGGLATYSDSMTAGTAYVYKMTTGSPNSVLASLALAEYASTYVPERTVVISETPCDFNPLSPTNAWGVGANPIAYFSVGLKSAQANYVALKANTTYYINIKNANWEAPDIDTCLAGRNCRFVMSLRH